MSDNNTGEQGTSSPPPPLPCANGCGFFGSPSTLNMCSKCFRESGKAKPTQPTAQASTPVASPVVPQTPSSPSVAAPSVPAPSVPLSSTPLVSPSEVSPVKLLPVEQPTAPAEKPLQKHRNRCWNCRKKVGLTGFECHCGYVFCSSHRYAEMHDCDYDYRSIARQQLAKANPLVIASKLDKI